MLEKGQEYLRDTDPEIFSAITDELDFGNLSLSQDLDLSGFALQAGLLFTF